MSGVIPLHPLRTFRVYRGTHFETVQRNYVGLWWQRISEAYEMAAQLSQNLPLLLGFQYTVPYNKQRLKCLSPGTEEAVNWGLCSR
jgi:hypothetical protein